MVPRTYFNEIEPFAAQWIRNGFPDAQVDERSIVDIDQPSDAIRQHYFAGAGGWEYALRLAGWPDEWPVWTGSCPCQPFSAAGKQSGVADERHLWPAFQRLVAIGKPPIIFGEQVASAIQFGWIDGVFDSLEALGYACGAAIISAASVNSPHIRQRLYWVAISSRERFDGERIRLQSGQSRKASTETAGSGEAGRMAVAEPQHNWRGQSGTISSSWFRRRREIVFSASEIDREPLTSDGTQSGEEKQHMFYKSTEGPI